LARLLSPLGADALFPDHWEREHLHIARDDPTHYDDLICGADLATLIADPDSRYPSIRLAQAGGFFSPEAYTQNLRYGGGLSQRCRGDPARDRPALGGAGCLVREPGN
jgi:hypothetical protein